LDLSDLSVEVSGHQGLVQSLHTVHIGLDAAPAVIPGPSLPNGSTEVARGIHCIVPSDGSGRGGLLKLYCRPGLLFGGGTQTISGANQMDSDPRCFNAVLYDGQFLVLYFVGDPLLIPASYHAGFTQ
jgi:hypothetical protein